MRIKKIRQSLGAIGNVADSYTTDSNACYNAPYVNNLNTYSTDEIRIGTWINGKSLYRKVINFGTLPNNASKAYNIADLNIENLVNLSGIAKIGANDKYCFPLPFLTPKGTLAEGISLYKNDTNIEIVAGTDRSGYSAYIIIEYTKTTD